MINIIFALLLIYGIIWTAKKFYFPTEVAQNPEKYPVRWDARISKKELSAVLTHLQRWRKEGKISREEYDHMTDICLSEMQQVPDPEKPKIE